jgi:hypothetical protein
MKKVYTGILGQDPIDIIQEKQKTRKWNIMSQRSKKIRANSIKE